MTTENKSFLDHGHIDQVSGILPGGRRPEGKIPDATNVNTTSVFDTQVKTIQHARRRTFSTAYKLKILETYEACDNPLARNALLRKEGLYHARLSLWRNQRDAGKFNPQKQLKTPKILLANQQLTRQNAALKKKLAQAQAIIELQKKVSELLGQHVLQAESIENN